VFASPGKSLIAGPLGRTVHCLSTSCPRPAPAPTPSCFFVFYFIIVIFFFSFSFPIFFFHAGRGLSSLGSMSLSCFSFAPRPIGLCCQRLLPNLLFAGAAAHFGFENSARGLRGQAKVGNETELAPRARPTCGFDGFFRGGCLWEWAAWLPRQKENGFRRVAAILGKYCAMGGLP